MGKSVALAGFATSTRDCVHSVNADEIWSLNMIHSSEIMRKTFPLNITRLFDIHPVWMLKSNWYATTGDHWTWMQKVKHHYPVYLVERLPEVHNSVRYPIEAVSEKFLSRLHRDGESIAYFTSSFCYMMALALYEGFSDIYVTGFEMGSDTEYVYQKAGAEFWLGIGSQHANIHIPEASHLLKARLYGFDTDGQIITTDLLNEYHAWYLARNDELSHMPPGEAWVEIQMIIGAVSFLRDTIEHGAITRQVLEGYKEDWDKKVRKFQGEINTLNAQGWEKHNNGDSSEDLIKMAFERLKVMYRYDGAYQVVIKLIGECDLQKPDKKLLNRHVFQKFSEVKETLNQ